MRTLNMRDLKMQEWKMKISARSCMHDACGSGKITTIPFSFVRPVHTRQQIVARNGNIVAAPVKVAVSGNNLLQGACGQALSNQNCVAQLTEMKYIAPCSRLSHMVCRPVRHVTLHVAHWFVFQITTSTTRVSSAVHVYKMYTVCLNKTVPTYFLLPAHQV